MWTSPKIDPGNNVIEYRVCYKNGEDDIIKSKMHGVSEISDNPKTYLSKGLFKRVRPKDTEYIYGNDMMGTPSGDHWIFNPMGGRISTWTYYPSSNKKAIALISKEDDKKVKYSLVSVRKFIQDDPRAMTYANIELGGNLASFGLLMLGMAAWNIGDATGKYEIKYGSLSVLLAPILFLCTRTKYKAITAYNQFEPVEDKSFHFFNNKKENGLVPSDF